MQTRALVIAIPTSIALLVGASALVTSPTACACHSSAQIVALAAGIDASWDEAAALSPSRVEKGLEDHFVGRNPDPRELFPSEAFGCTKTTKATVECFVETGESWLLTKGWLIRLERAPDGTVTNASVSGAWGHRQLDSRQ